MGLLLRGTEMGEGIPKVKVSRLHTGDRPLARFTRRCNGEMR